MTDAVTKSDTSTKSWKERLFHCLLGAYSLCVAATLGWIAWRYAGLGEGKWRGSLTYSSAAGDWHISIPAYSIYWPGLWLLLAVLAAGIAVGWLVVFLYRRSGRGSGAGTEIRRGSMCWPLLHGASLLFVLWHWLAGVVSQGGEIALCSYLLLVVFAVIALAVAFAAALALHRLFRWSLVFCYLVLVLFVASVKITVGS